MQDFFRSTSSFFNPIPVSPDFYDPLLNKLLTLHPEQFSKKTCATLSKEYRELTSSKKDKLYVYIDDDIQVISQIESSRSEFGIRHKNKNALEKRPDFYRIHHLFDDLEQIKFWASYLKYDTALTEAHFIMDAIYYFMNNMPETPDPKHIIMSAFLQKIAAALFMNSTLQKLVICFKDEWEFSDADALVETLMQALCHNIGLKTFSLALSIDNKAQFLHCLKTLLAENKFLEEIDFPYINASFSSEEWEAIHTWMQAHPSLREIHINGDTIKKANRPIIQKPGANKYIVFESLQNIFFNYRENLRAQILKPLRNDKTYDYVDRTLGVAQEDALFFTLVEKLTKQQNDIGFYVCLALAFHYEKKQDIEKISYYLTLVSDKPIPGSFPPLPSTSARVSPTLSIRHA